MKEEIDENSEMRLCKYVLTFEAKMWSIIMLPLLLVNWCIVGSIVRITWIPLILYIWFYQILPLSDNFKTNTDLFFAWFFFGIGIFVAGIISTTYLTNSDSDTVKYLKSKWMWK